MSYSDESDYAGPYGRKKRKRLGDYMRQGYGKMKDAIYRQPQPYSKKYIPQSYGRKPADTNHYSPKLGPFLEPKYGKAPKQEFSSFLKRPEPHYVDERPVHVPVDTEHKPWVDAESDDDDLPEPPQEQTESPDKSDVPADTEATRTDIPPDTGNDGGDIPLGELLRKYRVEPDLPTESEQLVDLPPDTAPDDIADDPTDTAEPVSLDRYIDTFELPDWFGNDAEKGPEDAEVDELEDIFPDEPMFEDLPAEPEQDQEDEQAEGGAESGY